MPVSDSTTPPVQRPVPAYSLTVDNLVDELTLLQRRGLGKFRIEAGCRLVVDVRVYHQEGRVLLATEE